MVSFRPPIHLMLLLTWQSQVDDLVVGRNRNECRIRIPEAQVLDLGRVFSVRTGGLAQHDQLQFAGIPAVPERHQWRLVRGCVRNPPTFYPDSFDGASPELLRARLPNPGQ